MASNNRNVFLHRSVSQKSWTHITRLKSRCWWSHTSSKGRIHPLTLLAFAGSWHSLACGFISQIFKYSIFKSVSALFSLFSHWIVSGLFCDPMDYSPLGSCTSRISQARILEGVTISFSKGTSQPRDWTGDSCISYIGSQILNHWVMLGSPDSTKLEFKSNEPPGQLHSSHTLVK